MPSNTGNTVSDAPATMYDKLPEAASQAKSKGLGLGRAAADKVDESRDSGVGGLKSAADYVRENDVSSMMTDLARLVKNNPGPAMLCAAALGFLVARSFSDD